MKLKINNVSPDDLADELRRRRAALIDALCEELRITDHKVEHEPSSKQRAGRVMTDYLTERVTVDGIVILLEVRTCYHHLVLRFTYVLPDQDYDGSRFRTAKEPKAGFDVIKLAKRILHEVADGVDAYARDAILAHAEELAEAITNAYGASPARFFIHPSPRLSDGDFGPLRVTFSGLCEHLTVRLIEMVIAAHQAADCGSKEGLLEALAHRAATTPKSEMN